MYIYSGICASSCTSERFPSAAYICICIYIYICIERYRYRYR